MANISEKLSKWRAYFGSTNSDIFDIIENAVMVAAIDHPKEFKLRRDRITELLFTFNKNTSDLGCDNKVEFVVPSADKVVPNGNAKVEFVVPNADEVVPNDVNVNVINSVSYRQAEALNDELEKEARIVDDVRRIKKIFDNFQNESDLNIYECLRKLQLMDISVDMMKDTNIGRSLNALRKHNSKNIKHLAKTMVRNWMAMVDEWMEAKAAYEDRTPEFMKTSIDDKTEEGGLPSPPLEDLPYLSTKPTSIPLSEFFDGIDDDGNLKSNGNSSIKSHESDRKTSVENNNNNPVRNKQELTKNTIDVPKDKKGDTKLQQMRPVPTQENEPKCPDEGPSTHMKFDAIKRKIQKCYQEVENAKKQRTIQVIKLSDIPNNKTVRKRGRPRKIIK